MHKKPHATMNDVFKKELSRIFGVTDAWIKEAAYANKLPYHKLYYYLIELKNRVTFDEVNPKLQDTPKNAIRNGYLQKILKEI